MRPTPHSLQLCYRLTGELVALRIPDPVAIPAATPGLWHHTCFELFLRAPDATAYEEYNFSPSLHWDYYRFSCYRQPDPTARKIAPALTRHQPSATELIVTATVPLPVEEPLDLGLTAVIESSNGTLSYWALHHAAAQPDFHDPASFVLRL